MRGTSLGYKFSLAVVPRLFSGLSRLFYLTYRTTEYGPAHLQSCGTGPLIAVFWHYGLLYYIHRPKMNRSWVAMVSASRDGEYVARLMENMGYEACRGSRGKGGLAAIKGMTASIKAGASGVIIGDGSQGPPQELQAGVILLAARTGTPILPMAWAADRYKCFKSWDRTVLPMPFARIAMWYGEPLAVPGKLNAKSLEFYRSELERRLNTIYKKAWQVFGREGH